MPIKTIIVSAFIAFALPSFAQSGKALASDSPVTASSDYLRANKSAVAAGDVMPGPALIKRGGRQPIDAAKGIYSTMIPGVMAGNKFEVCPEKYIAIGSPGDLKCELSKAYLARAAEKGMETQLPATAEPRMINDEATLLAEYIEPVAGYKVIRIGTADHFIRPGFMNWLKFKIQVLPNK